MFDPEKRKIVMGRSRKLGHCICNPKDSCPCELFKEKNLCLCAGERPDAMPDRVELTKFVENAGCASKIKQKDLKAALAGLPKIKDHRVLVSSNTCDDAGIFKLNDELALVQSVDIFTPNVDDAYAFGQIAAANSVSDIYAMGGQPLTALSIIGFPIEKLSHAIMNRMLKGGIDKMKEAGVSVIGGHSIKDNEIKLGFAVTGSIHPHRIITNSRAQPGDLLILTKPLGTGIISFAQQLGQAFPFNIAAISRSMATLNKTAAEIMNEMNILCGTDVTGFGILGHLTEMVVQSQVSAEIAVDRIPLFSDVLAFAKKDLISGAVERNKEYASQYVSQSPDIGPGWEAVLYDPQTSGGILMAVGAQKADRVVKVLKQRGVKDAAIIGKITKKSSGKIHIRHSL